MGRAFHKSYINKFLPESVKSSVDSFQILKNGTKSRVPELLVRFDSVESWDIIEEIETVLKRLQYKINRIVKKRNCVRFYILP